MTPEEIKALKAEMLVELKAEMKAESTTAPAAAVVEKPEAVVMEFVGDMSKPEDVAAHAQKLKDAQMLASVDWSDPASVMAYHKSISVEEEVPSTPAQSNQDVMALGVLGQEGKGPFSKEQSAAALTSMEARLPEFS